MTSEVGCGKITPESKALQAEVSPMGFNITDDESQLTRFLTRRGNDKVEETSVGRALVQRKGTI